MEFLRDALQARGRGGNAGALTGKVGGNASRLRLGGCVAPDAPPRGVITQQTVTVEGYRVRVGAALASGGFGFGALRVCVCLWVAESR
jgi:hypothetical protein